MEKELERLESKVDKIYDKVTGHGESLAKLGTIAEVNSESLQTHIKRTDILQSRQFKIIVGLAIGMGFIAASQGPAILRFLGILL